MDTQKLVDNETRQAAEDIFATMVDVFDEQCEKINQTESGVEERTQNLMRLFMKVTEPKSISALESLIDRLPELEKLMQLAAEMPDLFATLVDVFDEFAAQLKEDGVDLEKSVKQGLHAALWLGCRVSHEELERLGYLLRSDVLDPHALEVVGHAGTSLARCQQQSCELSTPDQVGVFGVLKAMRDPNVQRSIGFALRFARCFGGCLSK